MQLVAYGAQDIYLTGNPQITFFKVVYRRHTNFSMEAIEQTLNGSATYGNKATATISRNGDLVGRMYLEHTMTTPETGVDWANNYGHGLLREVVVEIGGQQIDKHYAKWLTAYSELTEFNPTSTTNGPTATEFGGTLYQKMAGVGCGLDNVNHIATTYFIPLQFWFCRNPGLALPLIALQYHEVKVSIQFEDQAKLNSENGTATITNKLWADYFYLDTDERRRFAQVSHEYLIEQLQYTSFSSTGATGSHDLNFNHPVKELVWGFSSSTYDGSISEGGTPEAEESNIASFMSMDAGAFKLKLNGHDRFSARNFEYFTRTQVWQHHTGSGNIGIDEDSICVYSFALKPEEHQPSGTCNFSRIDNAQLEITTACNSSGTNSQNPGGGAAFTTLHVYAVNYNVLRVMSGMGGLAYSN